MANLNNRGFISFSCCLAMVVSFGLTIIFLKSIQYQNRLIVNQAKSYLCIQKQLNSIRNHIKQIEFINTLIINLKYIKYLSKALGIPGILLSEMGEEAILQLLKTMGILEIQKFQTKNYSLKRNGCPFPILSLKSPYTSNGLVVNRRLNHTAYIKRPNWKMIYHLPNTRMLKLDFEVIGQTLQIQSEALF